jgi:hypothetical protein
MVNRYWLLGKNMQAHSSQILAHSSKLIAPSNKRIGCFGLSVPLGRDYQPSAIALSAISYELSAPGTSDTQTPGNASSTENTMNRALRVVIAGGGTGGHLFPGIAIANEFMARNSATRIKFVSTGNPLEKAVLSKAGFDLQSIQVAGIKGRGIWNQIASVLKIPGAILAAMGFLKRFSPDLIVGLGSYSAGPVVIGAWRVLRIGYTFPLKIPGRVSTRLRSVGPATRCDANFWKSPTPRKLGPRMPTTGNDLRF